MHAVLRGITAVTIAVLATVLFVGGVVVTEAGASTAGASTSDVPPARDVAVPVSTPAESGSGWDDSATPHVVISGLCAVALLVVVGLTDAWRNRMDAAD